MWTAQNRCHYTLKIHRQHRQRLNQSLCKSSRIQRGWSCQTVCNKFWVMLLSAHTPDLDEVCCVHCLDNHCSDFPAAKFSFLHIFCGGTEPFLSPSPLPGFWKGSNASPSAACPNWTCKFGARRKHPCWGTEKPALLRDGANRTFPLHVTALNVSTHGRVSKGEFYLGMATGR